MFQFNQRIKPAVESHLNAQLSFFNDMSQTLFQSVQKISELNLQLAQALVEDGTQAGRDMAAAQKPDELLTASTSQAGPAAEKLRVYRQNLADLAAQAQTALSRCAEEHAPETQRTAKELADAIIQITAEESEKAMRRPQAMLEEAKAKGEAYARDEGRTRADFSNGAAAMRNAAGEMLDAQKTAQDNLQSAARRMTPGSGNGSQAGEAAS